MKRAKRQSGQATIELCIGLLGIVFVIVAILYFGGIGITSIKTLLLARQQAEDQGSHLTEGGINGPSIQSWEYTRTRYNQSDNLDIPFLADDRPVGGGSVWNDYLSDATYSLGAQPSDDLLQPAYEFIPLYEERTLNYTPRIDSGNPFDIANLTFSSGYLPSELSGGEDEFYTMYKTKNAGKMKENLKRAGLFDFTTVKILDWRSNIVAFPAFGSRRDAD